VDRWRPRRAPGDAAAAWIGIAGDTATFASAPAIAAAQLAGVVLQRGAIAAWTRAAS
jgi:hypothetical protein